MTKEFEGYAREYVLLARLADSVELRDQPIQLQKSTALSATPEIRLLFITCQQMEIGTKPIPISVLTAVTNSTLNAASVFPSRRIEISESHTDLNRSADISIFRLWTRLCKIFRSRQNSTSISEPAIIEWQIESVLFSRAAKIVLQHIRTQSGHVEAGLRSPL